MHVQRDNLPIMLADMLRFAYTIGRLTTWEDDITKHAPATPGPSPLKLHAIFDSLLYSDREDTEFEALQFGGQVVLKCVASITMYCKHSSDTVGQLESRAQELTDPCRLAIMMYQRILPVVLRGLANVAAAAHMVEALVGAQYTDSDFLGVIKLWGWLAEEVEFGVALKHLHGIPNYTGRTPTYTEMWERREVAARELRVVYTDHGEVLYRCAGAGTEERGATTDRHPLAWDYSLRTFRSQQLSGRWRAMRDPEQDS